MFQTAESLSCDQADWLASLDRVGWSVCPRSTTYLEGLYRSEYRPGDERVGRIEYGRCGEATDAIIPISPQLVRKQTGIICWIGEKMV